MPPTAVHPHQPKPLLVRLVLACPRTLLCLVFGLATALPLPPALAQQRITKTIGGWNVGACLYLLLALVVSAAPMLTGKAPSG